MANPGKWLAWGEHAVSLRASVGQASVLAPIASNSPFMADAEVPAFRLSGGIAAETEAAFQLITGPYAFGERRYITLEVRQIV